MPVFPEREKIPIQERPEEASPLTIEKKEVATPIPVQFRRQVISDKGQPLIATPATTSVTVTIPQTPTVLAALAKGSVSDSVTWFAAFWLRMIKKAVHFGWQLFQK
jgi:hypothetical protein